MNTANDFALGVSNNVLTPLIPVYITSRQQAYRTAAWILLMGGSLPVNPEEDEAFFTQIVHSISNS